MGWFKKACKAVARVVRIARPAIGLLKAATPLGALTDAALLTVQVTKFKGSNMVIAALTFASPGATLTAKLAATVGVACPKAGAALSLMCAPSQPGGCGSLLQVVDAAAGNMSSLMVIADEQELASMLADIGTVSGATHDFVVHSSSSTRLNGTGGWVPDAIRDALDNGADIESIIRMAEGLASEAMSGAPSLGLAMENQLAVMASFPQSHDTLQFDMFRSPRASLSPSPNWTFGGAYDWSSPLRMADCDVISCSGSRSEALQGSPFKRAKGLETLFPASNIVGSSTLLQSASMGPLVPSPAMACDTSQYSRCKVSVNDIADYVWLQGPSLLASKEPMLFTGSEFVSVGPLSTTSFNGNSTQDIHLGGILIPSTLVTFAADQAYRQLPTMKNAQQVLDNANLGLNQQRFVKSGRLTKLPLDKFAGYIYEHHQAATFNENAARKGEDLIAKMTCTNRKGSPDVLIFKESTSKLLESVQCKSGKTAAQQIKRADYKDMQKVIPTKTKAGVAKAPGVDHAMSYGKVSAETISQEKLKKLAQQAMNGKAKLVLKTVGRTVGNVLVVGSVISTAYSVGDNILDVKAGNKTVGKAVVCVLKEASGIQLIEDVYKLIKPTKTEES